MPSPETIQPVKPVIAPKQPRRGDVKSLVEDHRFQDLPWEKKKIALDRFAEAHPSPTNSFVQEIQRLEHFASDGNTQDQKFNRSMLDARKQWFRDLDSGEDSWAADQAFEAARSKAKDVWKADAIQRQRDIDVAVDLTDSEERTGASVGNILAILFHEMNPVTKVQRAAGLETEEDIENTIDHEKQKNLIRILTERGYDEEGIETLKRDAKLATSGSGEGAAVDSQGNIAINDGLLVRDIDAVREAVQNTEAADSVKKSKLASLEDRRRNVIDRTFHSIVAGGGARWFTDKQGKAGAPTLSPSVNLGNLFPEVVEDVVKSEGESTIDRRAEAAGVARSAEKFNKDSIPELEKKYGWDFAARDKAVKELISKRSSILDRAGIGLGHGLLNDLTNMALTPFEIAGADFAKEIAEDSNRSSKAFSSADRLAEISDTAEFVELGSRILPQVILTRKAGGLGKQLASRASQATQARVAATFATGFGGLQSATFNARDVLDNEGSPQDALAAGILGFGTTFLLSNGFNAIGAGGVEDFRRTASASANAAKSQLRQRLGNLTKGAAGEGVEEFVDEFINGLITQDYSGASSDALASNAFKAALLGGGFGGAFGAARPTVATITPSTSDSDVGIAADEALEDLQKPKNDALQEADIRIAALENKEKLDETEQAELDSLIARRADLADPAIDLGPDAAPTIDLGPDVDPRVEFDPETGLDIPVETGNLTVEEKVEADIPLTKSEQADLELELSEATALEPAVEIVEPPVADTVEETAPAVVEETAPVSEEVIPPIVREETTGVLGNDVPIRPENRKFVGKEVSSRVRAEAEETQEIARSSEKTVTEAAESNLKEATAPAKVDVPLAQRSHKQLKEAASVINEKIKLNRTRGLYPELTNTQPIRLNRSKADLIDFIEGRNSGLDARSQVGEVVDSTKLLPQEKKAVKALFKTEGRLELSDADLTNVVAARLSAIRGQNKASAATKSDAAEVVKGIREKTGQKAEPEPSAAPTIDQAFQDDLEVREFLDEDQENSIADAGGVRQLMPSVYELSKTGDIQRIDEIIQRIRKGGGDVKDPTAFQELLEFRNRSSVQLEQQMEEIVEILTDTTDTEITEDQRTEIEEKLEETTTIEEVEEVEQEIVEAILENDPPAPRVAEDVDVDEFLATANAYQKEQFTERFLKGEDSIAIVTDLANNGSSELLSDKEAAEALALDEIEIDNIAREIEEPTIMYSVILPLDPQLIIKTAKSLYKGIKSFGGFVKRMVEGFGNSVKPILGKLFRDLKKGKGELDEAAILETKEESTEELPIDSDEEAAAEAASPDSPSADTPSTSIPLISRETANKLGQEKQSLIDLVDKTTSWKPVSAVIEFLGSIFDIPIKNTQILLQNVKDFAPNLAIAANAFSMSTLQSEAKVMRSLLEQKFPDLDTTITDEGNVQINGVLRKDGGPTPKYFSDLAEAVQADFDAFDFASDNVRDFFLEVVAYNKFAIKMAASEGVDIAGLLNEDGTGIDLSRIDDVAYAPRGRVTHRDILDNPVTHGDHKSRMATTGAKGQRKFDSEQQGIDAKYIYPDHPFDRLVNQITAVKATVYNQRLFNDSSFRSVAVPETRQEIVAELVDPETGETTVKKVTVRKGREKLEDTVRLGGLSMRTTVADAKTIQASIDRIHTSNGFLNALADAASIPSKLTLALDMSAAFNQNLYSLFTNPKGWGKSISLSVQDLVGKRDNLRAEIAGRADYIKLAVQHGGQWATIAEEFIDNRAQAKVLERQRSGTESVGRKGVRPLQRVFTKFGEFQGLMQSLAATYTFEADIIKLKEEGRFTPENIGLAAKSADNIHGRENLTRYGLSHNLVTMSRAVLTAAGMYAGFTAVVLDMASKNPQKRRNAMRRLGLFATGVHVSYFMLAMAAEMMGEDEDNETTMANKAKKIAKRMVPGSKGYLSMDIPWGNGTKTLMWGGFYRGLMNAVTGSMFQNVADTLGAENANLDSGTVERMGNFMGGKIRNSFQMTEQLITGEDYFNNPSTMVETLRANLIPLSLGPTAVAASDPVLTYLHKNTGLDLVTLERVAEEKPDLKLTVFDTITNFVGINGYVAGDSAKFNRALDVESKGQFGKRYDELSMQEARSVRKEVNRNGLLKPAFKGKMDDIIEMNRKKFRRELGGTRFNNLDKKTIDSLSARIPFNVVMKTKEEPTRVPADLREKMRAEIIEGYQEAIDSGLRNDALRTKAKDVANKVRKNNGLPIVR